MHVYTYANVHVYTYTYSTYTYICVQGVADLQGSIFSVREQVEESDGLRDKGLPESVCGAGMGQQS